MAKDKDAEATEETPKGGKKKKLLIMVGALALVLGAVWFFFLKGSDDPAAAAEKNKPKKGEVVVADPIYINLADGHFLKLGMALQANKAVKEAPAPAEALDAAVALYTGKELDELQDKKEALELKEKLNKTVVEKYTIDEVPEILEVYFTEFVVQ